MNEIDRHITQPSQLCTGLPMLENALLWAMRAWVIGHSRRMDVSERIVRVFDRLGAADAAPHLARFMRALAHGASRVLEVHCVCHTEVSADEATLLHVFALHQEEAYEDAFALLGTLMADASTVSGCDTACRLALSLQDAGQTLQRKPDAAAAGDPRWSDRGGYGLSQTIH